MKIKTLILLALTMLTQELFAQSALEAELQNNYFLARNRFKKWFVTVGSKPGNSVPYETLIIDSKFGYPFSCRISANHTQFHTSGNEHHAG